MHDNKVVYNPFHTEIYWFFPNLIGYLRIILALSAFCICFTHPYWFTALYGTSQLLDSMDGYFARRLNKVTTYGAMLDMVLDRASTTALLIILTRFYPACIKFIIIMVLIDLISHFLYIYSSLLHGKKSHKTISTHQNYLLKLYYGNSKALLVILCIGSEGCLLWYYLQHFGAFIHADVILQQIIAGTLACLFFIKQIVNIIQLREAIKDIVVLDIKT